MDLHYDFWIILIAVLCATACALPGCFLVLRRMSLMSDAISHAVLPGLAIAFLLTGERTSVLMFLGAVIAGIATAAITNWIHRSGKMEEGASMGIVFTTFFALGLLLIANAAHRVDLDADCVLYGSLELTPLDISLYLSVMGETIGVPRAVLTLGAVVVVNALLIAIFYKEFRITTFDPDLAASLGIQPARMHYLLMTMVAVTAVAAFEVVGSIIVIAMFIVPPVTAYLLTDRLLLLLLLSVAIGALSALLGHPLAIWIPHLLGYSGTSSAGMIALASGLIFLITFLFAPRYGICTLFRRKSTEPQPSEATDSTQL